MLNKEQILSKTIQKNVFTARIDNDKAFIVTLSDLHIGTGNLEYIREIVNFILSIEHCYVIIGGDLVNNTTRSSKGTVLEEYASGQEQIKLAVDLLKPLADNKRVLCICDSGNHEARTKQESFISITQIIATMMGIPEKCISDFAIGYINIKDICYIYANIHKHRKTNNYYSYLNADILYLEHTHEFNFKEKIVVFHNKYTKKPSFRSVYEINNGSALAFPSYAKLAGYSPQIIGTYITELSGKDRNIIIWKDIDLITAIKNGYKI